MKRFSGRIAIVMCAGVLAASAFADERGGQEAGAGVVFQSKITGSNPSVPIAGVGSGGAPWSAAGRAMLQRDGTLKVEVDGLLLAAGASINTVGPVLTVKASLVCGNQVVGTTAEAQLSAAGDAEMEGALTLPPACFAPAVLVRIGTTTGGPSATGPWIAATGFTTTNLPGHSDDN